MEAVRPSSPSGPPEAGSLSSALPRRAPPPPPPSLRGSSLVDDVFGSAPKAPPAPPAPHMPPGPPAASRGPLPPPPPPPVPAKRESKVVPAVSDPFPPPSGPSDINLDDEDDALGTPHPHITVPPLKPAVQPSGALIDLETPHGSAGVGQQAHLPPPPPYSADGDEDVASSQPESPPDPDDVFAPIPTEAPNAPRKVPEAAKTAESPKAKPARAQAAKHGSRLLDRDVPEWLAHLLESDGVTAVFVTGTNQAEVQRDGRRESVSVPTSDLAALGTALRKLVSKGAPKPASDATAVDTTLPDGLHIAAIFPPVADDFALRFGGQSLAARPSTTLSKSGSSPLRCARCSTPVSQPGRTSWLPATARLATASCAPSSGPSTGWQGSRFCPIPSSRRPARRHGSNFTPSLWSPIWSPQSWPCSRSILSWTRTTVRCPVKCWPSATWA
jgi:hypothetical protein